MILGAVFSDVIGVTHDKFKSEGPDKVQFINSCELEAVGQSYFAYNRVTEASSWSQELAEEWWLGLYL